MTTTLAPFQDSGFDYGQGGALQPKPIAPSAPTTGKGAKKVAKNGLNQMQQSLISNLFNTLAPSLGGLYQSNFNSDVQPSLFNFDPSKAYQGFQGMNAAQSDFNADQYLSNPFLSQAAQSNYDPSQWLNQYNTNYNASQSNFNPNNFMSGLTGDYIANIGSDADALTAIRNNMAGIGNLPQLDASTQGQLNNITRANTGQIDQQFGDAKKALLQDLFSRGLNTSTVALDQGGRLAYGRDQLTQQEQANAANRQIGLQQNVRDFSLQNLLGQASTVRDQYQAKAQQAGLSQQGDLARMSSALQNSLFNAGALNEAGQFNAQSGLQKALAGNQTASQQSMFNAGNQQQSNLANQSAQNQNQQLMAQLMQQVSLQNAGFNQQANQFNAQSDLGIRDQINQLLAQNGMFNTQNINQANQFNTGLNQQTNQNNLSAIMQQNAQKTDLLSNAMNSFFGRKQGNKQLNYQYNALEQERQQQEAQRAFQYYQLQQQIQAQKGGLFGKIFGGLAGALPGIGSIIGALKPK